MQKIKNALKGKKALLGFLLSMAALLLLIPVIVLNTAPMAEAATVNVTNLSQLQNAIATAPTNGTEHIINVNADIIMTDNGMLTITSGKNITLNIGSSYQIARLNENNRREGNGQNWWLDFEITQRNPILNIAEGATVTLTGGGKINITARHQGNGTQNWKFLTRTAVMNAGTLNIVDGTIAATPHGPDDWMSDSGNGSDYGDNSAVCVGIRNAATGTVNMSGGMIQARASAFSRNGLSNPGYAHALALGIQNDKGGTVNMSGGVIDAFAKTGSNRYVFISGRSDSSHFCHAWGIDNGNLGKTTMTGGSINAQQYTDRNSDVCKDGTYTGTSIGIGYTGANYPNIHDGEIKSTYLAASSAGPHNHTEVAVGPVGRARDFQSNNTGAFYEEGNHQIATGGSATMSGGMTPDKVKVAVYYRFWHSSSKTGTPQVFNSSDPNLPAMLGDRGGKDYLRLGDASVQNPNPGTGTVPAQPYAYNSSGTVNKGYASAGRWIGYNSGGMPYNTDFFYLQSLSRNMISTTTAPNHVSAAHPTIAEFNRSDNYDPQNNLYRNNGMQVQSGNKVYIYLDYVMQSTHELRVSLSSDPAAQLSTWTMTYQNRATVAGTGSGYYDIPIYIFNSYGLPYNSTDPNAKPHKNITDAYNLNPSQTQGHLNVTYKHKLSTQGDDAFVDGLPVNANAAGQEYKVRVFVPSDTSYSPNAKNVAAPSLGYFEFTLKIERATVGVTPNEPFSNKPMYGTRLAGINLLDEVELQASFRHVDGSFSWDAGGNVVPNVVTGAQPYFVTRVTFTPSAAFISNYAPRSFDVKIQILPRELKIYAGSESSRNIMATYGDWPRYTSYFEGLAANDLEADGVTPKAAILSDLEYDVLVGGSYVSYKSHSAGGDYMNPNLDVGAYACRISGFDNPNYTVSYESGNLQIGKRTITVTAKAPEKKHYDNSFDVDIELTNPRGNAPWHTVGYTDSYNVIVPETVLGLMADYLVSNGALVPISLTTMPTLSGAQAGNYNIAVDGVETLATVIVKAMVSYVLPTFDEEFTYDAAQKLSNTAGTPFALPVVRNVDGHTNGYWQWDTAVVGTTPTVGNSGYSAKFIPDDLSNFDPVDESIVVPLKKKQVQVTIVLRNPSQETFYGDNIPGFAFDFIGFTGNDKESNVPMTGNYTMNCAYQKGSNAGEYPIIVTLNNLLSTNYEYVALNSSLTVKKRPVYITPNSLSREYGYVLNMGEFTVQVENMVEGDNRNLLGELSFTTDYSHNSLESRSVKEGGYEIRVTAAGSPVNYEIVPRTGKLTITRAELKFTAGDYIGLEYNSPAPDLTDSFSVTGYKFNETAEQAYTGIPLVSTSYIQGNPVDNYDISIQRNTLNSTNYTISIEQRNGYLSVVPAMPTVTTWPTATVEYTKSLADAVINTEGAQSSIPGTYAFDLADYYPDYYTDNNPARVFKLVFYPSNSNFRSIDTNISITVLQKEIDGTVGISGSPMKGETLSVDLSAMNPDGSEVYTISWRDGEHPEIELGTGLEFPLDDSVTDKLIYVEITASGAYFGSKVSTPTSRIVDAVSLLDTTLDLFDINFDFGREYAYESRTITVPITKKPAYSSLMGGSVTIKYNNSTTPARDAGTYRITLDITAGSGYKPVSGLFVGEFTIEKAPLTVYYSPANKVYDGTKRATTEALTFDSPIGSDDVSVNTSNAAYAFASVDASNQQIPVHVSGAYLEGRQAQNYFIDDSRNLARIEKRPIQVVASPISRAYDPANYYVAVNFLPNYTGVLSIDRDYVALGAGLGRLPSNDNNAGYKPVLEVTADVVGTELGNKSHNYRINVTNLSGLTVEIERATPNYGTLPVIDPVTYDYDRPLSSIRISRESNNWSWISPALIPQVMNEGYAVRYTPGSSQINNYKIVDFVLPLTVKPKEVTMHANVSDVVYYGDPVPRINISYHGISPNENENDVIKGGPPTFTTDYYQYAPVGGDYSIFVNETSVFADNYDFVYNTASPAKITVNPVRLTTGAEAATRSYIPGDRSIEVSFGALAGILRNDDVKLASNTIQGEVADGSVGNNKRVFFNAPALTGTAAGNYEVFVGNQNNLLVDIIKAVPTGHVFPGNAVVEYGNTLAYARFTGASTGELGGYFYFEQREQRLDIGVYPNYVVIYQPGDAANYESVRQTVHLEVINASRNFNLSMTGTLQVDETLQAVVSGLDMESSEYLVFSWYRVNPSGGDPILLSNDRQYTLTAEDKGYRILLNVNLLSPYEGSRSIESSVTVTEEILTFWQRFTKWWYDLISAIQQIFGMMG